ncbi:hypothetical protein CEXT_602451 [Caerostris extrusa]|uniref:Uncharacterized protein n=1 Tax=Caerostris extrusa TaxID=172846 RepID=A0AAV4WGJ0_CAEEX|nr:hypothetical protein CEXT_602451 [Caerostris extrusa]
MAASNNAKCQTTTPTPNSAKAPNAVFSRIKHVEVCDAHPIIPSTPSKLEIIQLKKQDNMMMLGLNKHLLQFESYKLKIRDRLQGRKRELKANINLFSR